MNATERYMVKRRLAEELVKTAGYNSWMGSAKQRMADETDEAAEIYRKKGVMKGVPESSKRFKKGGDRHRYLPTTKSQKENSEKAKQGLESLRKDPSPSKGGRFAHWLAASHEAGAASMRTDGRRQEERGTLAAIGGRLRDTGAEIRDTFKGKVPLSPFSVKGQEKLRDYRRERHENEFRKK